MNDKIQIGDHFECVLNTGPRRIWIVHKILDETEQPYKLYELALHPANKNVDLENIILHGYILSIKRVWRKLVPIEVLSLEA